LQIKTINVSCHTTDSKPVKQEVNSTVILPPLVFPEEIHPCHVTCCKAALSLRVLLHNKQKYCFQNGAA